MKSNALISVAKQNGQAAASIVGANIVQVWQQCWAPSRRTAVWLAHPDAEAECITATVPVGTGGSELPLYKSSDDEDKPNTILGRPVIAAEYMQVPGTPGDLMLVDLSRYVLAMREITSAVSMHVAFLTDQMAYRVTMRVDGQTIDNRPITPFTGPNQVSPFVCIAQR